jgi:hypothetical protein
MREEIIDYLNQQGLPIYDRSNAEKPISGIESGMS